MVYDYDESTEFVVLSQSKMKIEFRSQTKREEQCCRRTRVCRGVVRAIKRIQQTIYYSTGTISSLDPFDCFYTTPNSLHLIEACNPSQQSNTTNP